MGAGVAMAWNGVKVVNGVCMGDLRSWGLAMLINERVG